MSNTRRRKRPVNKAMPEVRITLDKERTLRLDLNAMAAFEVATSKNLFDGTFQVSGMSARDLRAMLWACLLHEDESITEKQVGSWIAADNMAEIAAKLNEAFKMATSESGQNVGAAPLAETLPSG